jgi:hypothetical protein
VIARARRSRRGRLLIPLLVLLALAPGAACGPVDPPPPSSIPLNACGADECAAYQQPGGLEPAICSAGVCTSSSVMDLTLIVSLPETAFLDPGTTVAIPQFMSSYFPLHPCPRPAAPSCAVIPGAVQPTGSYVVSRGVESCAGRSPDPNGASLPVQVQLWPLWSAGPTAKVFAPASAIGLPLPALAGRARGGPDAIGAPVPGPSGTPRTDWVAQVGPGTYEEDLIPLDPAYPPQRFIGPVSSVGQFSPIESLDTNECASSPGPAPPLVTTFDITRGNGSLAGFSAYLRDASTARRISSLATLPDATTAPVTLLTSGVEIEPSGPWPAGSEIIVAPPAGAPVPTYADPIAPVTQLGPVNFPPLPTPMTVEGVVLGPDAQPIDADLVIDSTVPSLAEGGIAVCASSDCTQLSPASAQRPLSYGAMTHASASGGYSVVLPPGTYDVFVVPAVGANAGAASVTLIVQPILQPGLPPVAAGKTLLAPARATIRGTVKLADGRPLAGATVEAHAAASLAGTVVPAIGRVDRRRSPRPVGAVTDASGAFSLSADPGTYDVVVRPQDGTGFPWVTITSQSVAAGGDLSFAPPGSAIVVPAPIRIDMTLEDAELNSVTGAVVRAFSVEGAATPSSPGGPLPQVEIGAWLTDSEGHFSMFVAPPR